MYIVVRTSSIPHSISQLVLHMQSYKFYYRVHFETLCGLFSGSSLGNYIDQTNYVSVELAIFISLRKRSF